MKRLKRSNIRKIIIEEMERLKHEMVLNESMYDVFSRGWSDEGAWNMVTPESIMSVYDGIQSTDPQAFVDELPHEWQKPKVVSTLQNAGKLSKSGGVFASSSVATSGGGGPLETGELMALMDASLDPNSDFKLTQERLATVNRGNLTDEEMEIIQTV